MEEYFLIIHIIINVEHCTYIVHIRELMFVVQFYLVEINSKRVDKILK